MMVYCYNIQTMLNNNQFWGSKKKSYHGKNPVITDHRAAATKVLKSISHTGGNIFAFAELTHTVTEL